MEGVESAKHELLLKTVKMRSNKLPSILTEACNPDNTDMGSNLVAYKKRRVTSAAETNQGNRKGLRRPKKNPTAVEPMNLEGAIN